MFLESLNLTGIPSVVLLPVMGSFAHYGSYSFLLVFAVSVAASMFGNIIYYAVARLIGPPIYHYFYNKFKRLQKSLGKAKCMSETYGNRICLLGRLVPGVRAVISLLAGAFNIKMIDFLRYSVVGVGLWNLVLMAIGYGVGKTALL